MFSFKKSLLGLVGILVLVGGLAAVSRGQGNNPLVKQLQPRKFYLTQATHNASQALSACAEGYHMASLWEIHDPSNLRYDTELGLTRDDSGFGPPAAVLGWIRTGLFASDALAPGEANCNAWTEAGELQYGSAVTLIGSWNSPEERVISPWVAEVTQCSGSRFVWCVQD